MARFFRTAERLQSFLLPADMRDWLPDNDIVHLIVGAVSVMDLRADAVAGCVGNGRGCLRRGDGIALGGEVNHALGGRLTEALPAIDLAHADLA